jgi:hypothetical protein
MFFLGEMGTRQPALCRFGSWKNEFVHDQSTEIKIALQNYFRRKIQISGGGLTRFMKVIIRVLVP